jgi:putative tricarboxylic transport membrane protein
MSQPAPDPDRLSEAQAPDWAGAAGAVVFALVGAYVLWASLSMSTNAAAFPRSVGALLVGLSLIQLFRSATGRSSTILEEGVSLSAQKVGLRRRLTLIATMIAWAILFPIVGFVVTSFVAALVLTAISQFGRITAIRAAIYGVSITVLVFSFYLLMVHVLNIPLPRALLF